MSFRHFQSKVTNSGQRVMVCLTQMFLVQVVK